MNAEKDKMLRGELYAAYDPLLRQERLLTRRLLKRFNTTHPDEVDARVALLKELFGHIGGAIEIEPPFYCDYGYNICVGDNFYANFDCVILDCAKVRIGHDVLLAPGVHIYTATHPLDADTRVQKLERAQPVSIGSRVWIGGGAIVNPGVSIGDDSVIGAGSVVTKDVPAKVLAAGNPCKVIRGLEAA